MCGVCCVCVCFVSSVCFMCWVRCVCLFLLASGKMRGPEGVVDDPARQQWTGDKGALTVAYAVQLRSIKAKGCPRPKHPHNVSEETWLKV